jgi:hypothetical protein
MLSDAERAAILDREIQTLAAGGYRVVTQTATTAQLIKPKTFDPVAAVFWLLFLVVGLLVYLLIYASQSDEAVYLSVTEDGTVNRRYSGGSGGQSDPRRWTCETCGYRNTPSRQQCKRCHAERTAV